MKTSLLIGSFMLASLFAVDVNGQSATKISQGEESIQINALLKVLKNKLPGKKYEKAKVYVQQSFDAISKKNSADNQTAIKNFEAVMAADDDGGMSPWQSCGRHCDHINNPVEYGFCYWKCVLKGGPTSSAQPVNVPRQRN